MVDARSEGFRRGRKLEKVGQHAQDTAEIFFDNVHVPVSSLLGVEGQGFAYLMQELAQAVTRETAKWARIVKESGARAE